MSHEEHGYTRAEFSDAQEALERQIRELESEEANSKDQLYFIFASAQERDRAIQAIAKARDYDDTFRFLTNWAKDPRREDVGLELDFDRHPKDLEARVQKFFTDSGLAVQEKYEVIEMPRQRDAA